MNKTSRFFRESSLSALHNNWGMAILVYFIYLLISETASIVASLIGTLFSIQSFAFSYYSTMLLDAENIPSALAPLTSSIGSSILTIIVGFAVLPLTWALYCVYLKLLRGGEPEIPMLFTGYKDWRFFTTVAIKNIYIGLWTLLLIIPGIIKSYQYAMTNYILLDNPEKKNNEAIEMSMDMMRGNCLKLFCLDLSFIGWFLLCLLVSICTCGLGIITFLFLFPYWATARAAFYESLVGEFTNTIDEPIKTDF